MQTPYTTTLCFFKIHFVVYQALTYLKTLKKAENNYFWGSILQVGLNCYIYVPYQINKKFYLNFKHAQTQNIY